MQIEEILWTDAEYEGSYWHDKDKDITSPNEVRSVGYILKETDEFLFIAQSLTDDQKRRHSQNPKVHNHQKNHMAEGIAQNLKSRAESLFQEEVKCVGKTQRCLSPIRSPS